MNNYKDLLLTIYLLINTHTKSKQSIYTFKKKPDAFPADVNKNDIRILHGIYFMQNL
jgi:hypothetical protein